MRKRHNVKRKYKNRNFSQTSTAQRVRGIVYSYKSHSHHSSIKSIITHTTITRHHYFLDTTRITSPPQTLRTNQHRNYPHTMHWFAKRPRMTMTRILEMTPDTLNSKRRRSEERAELEFLDLCADARVVSMDLSQEERQPWYKRDKKLMKVFATFHR